jgi:hypothetical protein
MGRDFLGGPVWAFDITTNRASGPDALAAAAALARAWRTGIGTRPGVVFPLQYFTAGRLRRVYGRPRRYAGPAPDLLTRLGAAKITADFQCVDHLHYDDTQRSLMVDLVAAATGGWTFPTTFPIHTAPSMTRQGVIDDVGGDTRTPFELTIKGPVAAPWAAGPGWRLELPDVVLAYDQSVTVATYPWALTVLRNDGADLSGGLSWKSRLADACLSPGPGEFTFGGIDPTNTATATMRWRPAWSSL